MSEQQAVGIQLSGAQVRRAELRRAGSRIEIVHLDERTATPTDASPPAASANTAEANSVLRVAGLAGADVMTRCWKLPAARGPALQQVVAHRLEADLPIPMDQLTWACRPLNADGALSGQTAQDVIVQAARTERLTRHVAALSAAGLPPNVVTTETEAIGALYRHGLQPGRDGGAVVLILASPVEWLVAVLFGGHVRSVRRVRVEPGRPESACRECQQSVVSIVPLAQLRRVVWCGTADAASAPDALAASMRVTIEPAAPARELVGAGGESIQSGQLAQFGTALGLALIGLCEPDAMLRLTGQVEAADTARSRRIEQWLAHPWRCTAAAAAMLVLVAAIHVGSLYAETRAMRQAIADSETSKAARAELEPKVRTLQRIERYRLDIEHIVAALCEKIPQGMVLSSLNVSRERDLTIKGTAQPTKAVYELADALRESPHFDQVQPGRTEPGKGGGFTLTAELPGVQKLSTFGGRGRR